MVIHPSYKISEKSFEELHFDEEKSIELPGVLSNSITSLTFLVSYFDIMS